MSDAPETDNALHGVWYRGDHGSSIPELCRRLERERNEAIKDLEFRRGLFAVQEAQLNEVREELRSALQERHDFHWELKDAVSERDEAREKATKAWEENLRLDSENRRLERELNIVTEERDGARLKCQRIAGEMLARLAGM